MAKIEKHSCEFYSWSDVSKVFTIEEYEMVSESLLNSDITWGGANRTLVCWGSIYDSLVVGDDTIPDAISEKIDAIVAQNGFTARTYIDMEN